MVKQQIKRLEKPSLKYCQLVHDEPIRILGRLLAKGVRPILHLSIRSLADRLLSSIQAVPSSLRERFNSVVVNSFNFKKSMKPTIKLVTDMTLMQACYINTTHRDFVGGHQTTALVTEEKLNAAKAPTVQHDPKRATRILTSIRRGTRRETMEMEVISAFPPDLSVCNALRVPISPFAETLIDSHFNVAKRGAGAVQARSP